MKRLLLCVLFSVSCATASAQTVISGIVRNAKTNRSVGSVNVMLQNTARRAMYGYAITKDDGTYSLQYTGKVDTLLVVVTGFNIKEQTRTILARTQTVDFAVEEGELKIREVTVKAQSVERRSDTLSYNVASFANVTDRSIGDVLKKMPGIEVAKSGEIKYNGKSINKFYVEDLDMLGGRYGIATNNIQAKDIARVEVFENHQPIRALKKLVDSDRAAINLRLKDSSKGTWNGTMQLGAGYKPWMWNGEATAMYFGRRFQTIDTYKTNNMGDDVAREFQRFYDGLGEISSLLGVHRPAEPSLDEERYLDNNVHAVGINTITKLKKELEFTANAHYIHDYRIAEGMSQTTYFLPDALPLVVSETTDAVSRIDRTEVDIQLRSNTDNRYLQEKLNFAGHWNNDFGQVVNDGDPVAQRFHLPRITLRNVFYNVRRLGRTSLSFNSDTDYRSQPASLRIRPMLYPEVFDSPADYPDALQTLDSRRFRTRNSAFSAWTFRRWTFSLNASLNAQLEWMKSSLSPMDDAGATLPVTDAMRNDIYWRKLDFVVGPSIRYGIGDKLSMNLYLPVDFLSLRSEDKIRDRTVRMNDVIPSPSFSLQTAITYNLKFSARASYNELVGGLYDTYGGYIMTDYRMIASRQGDVSRDQRQNYTASLSYGNAIRALFGSVDVSYYRSKRNLMYGTTYEGSLSRIEAVAMDNRSDGYNLAAKVSKRFDGIATTVNLSGGFSQSWNEVLRQGELLPTRYDRTSAGLSFNTRFTQAVRLDYGGEYSRSESRAGSEMLHPIDMLRQHAALDFIIRKKFICRIGGEHCYNASIGGRDRNMFFLDASLSYKSKRVEYMLEGRNLLDTGTFRSVSQSDITDYVYSYKLRPASVMFKIKFSLK